MEISWSDDTRLEPAALAQLDALGASSVSAPFGDQEVLSAWHATMPPNRTIRRGSVYVNGDLVALLLLWSPTQAQAGEAARRWQLWGETIDFGVIWAEPRRALESWHLWVSGLREQGVERLRLRNVRMSDPVVSTLFGHTGELGVTADLLDRRLAPFVDLSNGFDDWLAGRSKSQRRQYRRAMRRFETVPDLRVSFVQDRDAVEGAMQDFFDLHRSRRAALTKSSVYDSGQAERFLKSLVGPWADRGRIGVLLATSHGAPIGVELVVTTESTWYSLNGGWREEFARFHVGTAMLLEGMQRAARARARRYSLLEGEEPYKMRMASGGHQLASWDLHLNATS